MKIFSGVMFLAILTLVLIFTVSCTRTEQYGSKASVEDLTSIGSILRDPERYEGKTVKIEGQITRECPTGCWFDLEDESGVIYVDLNPSSFAIPQKVNKKASTHGTVEIKDGRPTIVGEGVKIK